MRLATAAEYFVMGGLVPAVHDFLVVSKNLDARDKPGHDGEDGS